MRSPILTLRQSLSPLFLKYFQVLIFVRGVQVYQKIERFSVLFVTVHAFQILKSR